MTLHVGSTCSMPATAPMSGTATGLNCDVNTDGNDGCGVQAPTADSFGPPFNAIGGGWYAMERTTTSISVWFWERNNTAVPTDMSTGASSIDTSAWVSGNVHVRHCSQLTCAPTSGNPDSLLWK